MQAINVYCVNVGDKYSSEYVYKLKSAVERHLGFKHRFYCITDKTELYPFAIQSDDLPGYWNKLSIFKHKGRCLYFDLDVIIHGSINDLITDHVFRQINPVWKNPSKAKYIKDRPDLGTSFTNSSVMAWSDETEYETFNTNLIYSYRDGAHWQTDNEKFKYRLNYSVALFHQKPEIHDCLDHKIIKDNWI